MARTLIGSIAPNIHGINSADSLASDDELILYDSSSSANRKTKLSDFFAAIKSDITSIPYVFDYLDTDFAKIKAAYDEGRPVFMDYRSIMLQLVSCDVQEANFSGWMMVNNLGYCCVHPICARVTSDGKEYYSDSESDFPFPGTFVAKVTENNGVLSDNLTVNDWAFALIFDLVVEAEYNGLRYRLTKMSGDTTRFTRYFYAITVEDGAEVIHELTRTSGKAPVTWAHRTVKAQMVDIPSKLSQFENDVGYLTLDTLPKYEGVVE